VAQEERVVVAEGAVVGVARSPKARESHPNRTKAVVAVAAQELLVALALRLAGTLASQALVEQAGLATVLRVGLAVI
jgi:hypothetical protein